MSDLHEKFEAAAEAVQELTKKPNNDIMLQLYSLYKQATKGDVDGKRPGMMDFVGRAKYDAWAALKGTPSDEAKQGYVDLLESLKAG